MQIIIPFHSEDKEEVWNPRMDRDLCYKRTAFARENEYVKESKYISIFANEPWNAYSKETCLLENYLPAKNYCFYVTGRCNELNEYPIMRDDCIAYYERLYPNYYPNRY